MDPAQLFYMMSRGFSELEAKISGKKHLTIIDQVPVQISDMTKNEIQGDLSVSSLMYMKSGKTL